MKELIFETQGINTYLVYEMGAKDELDTLSAGMISNNKIDGIAPFVFNQMDENRYLKFNVSAKVSAKQFLDGTVNKKRLLGFFSGVASVFINADEYMIDPGLFLVDLDYIFVDVSTYGTALICLPVVQDETTVPDLAVFFKEIVFRTQFDQSENCDYVAKIISCLNGNVPFSIHEFKKVIDQLQSSHTGGAAPVVQTATVRMQAENTAPAAGQAEPVLPSGQYPMISQPEVQQVPAGQQRQSPAVPLKPTLQQQQQVAADKVSVESDEKEITFFYLMQHYNKENAAMYKAQKERKKQKVDSGADKPKKEKKKKKEVPQQKLSFAVPGAPQTPVQNVSQQAPSAQVSQAAPSPAAQAATIQPGTDSYGSRAVAAVSGVNFGETTVLNGQTAGETTVLNAAALEVVKPYLLRRKNNEKVVVTGPVFRIGKEKSYVDYFISDNTAVSRSHANIITRDNGYYIIDTNSKNHTYVNGTMIQGNTETQIDHGMMIRIANEEFTFQLY